VPRLNRGLRDVSGREKGVLAPSAPIAPNRCLPVLVGALRTSFRGHASRGPSLSIIPHRRSGWLAGTAIRILHGKLLPAQGALPPLLVDPALAGIVCATCPLVVHAGVSRGRRRRVMDALIMVFPCPRHGSLRL
jgi:hypothetical protein